MNTALDLRPVAPALVLVASGLIAILVQAFLGRARRAAPICWIVSLAGLAIAMALVWQWPLQERCGVCLLDLAGVVLGDGLARVLSLVILASAMGVVLLARDYGRKTGTDRGEQYGLTLFAVAGMLGLVGAVELVSLFVALEVMSVSLYALVGLRRGQAASQEAALKYFVTGAFSSALLLYGIALIYGLTGATQLMAIAAAPVRHPAMLAVATGLVLVGLGFKVASVPFHMWAPDVYEGAPTTVTALMASAAKVAAFGALARILFGGLPAMADRWQPALAVLAVLTMVLGNLAALAQPSLKRMLAYSSIAHAGYVLTAFVASPDVAVPAIVFYLAGYAAVSVGAFGALAALAREDGEPTTLRDVAGLAERRPALAAAITVLMISLAGVPVSAGFVGKLLLFGAAVQAGWTALAVVGVLMSVVSAYYYLRVVVAMYMRAPEGGDWARVGLASALALGAAVLAVLWLGIQPGVVLDVARLARIAE